MPLFKFKLDQVGAFWHRLIGPVQIAIGSSIEYSILRLVESTYFLGLIINRDDEAMEVIGDHRCTPDGIKT